MVGYVNGTSPHTEDIPNVLPEMTIRGPWDSKLMSVFKY